MIARKCPLDLSSTNKSTICRHGQSPQCVRANGWHPAGSGHEVGMTGQSDRYLKASQIARTNCPTRPMMPWYSAD
jgi:hypothetical protein